jgi:hypothetical protein
MTANHTTYKQGVEDAKNDLAEGWISGDEKASYIENQLKVVVGATDEYIRGYLTVVGV